MSDTAEDGVSRRTCLDLFSGKGGFSAAFDESDDWEVVTVDLNPEDKFDPDIQADVMDLRPSDLPDPDVVLASPPCNRLGKMAQCQDYFDGASPNTPGAREHVALFYHTLGLIRALDPRYWFLENPPGKARHYLGDPTGTVTYCQYGTEYQKRTHLWGRHPPIDYLSCVEGDDCHISTPRSDTRHPNDSIPNDQAEASKVPYELSLAIREAVEEAYANPPPEQSTLVSATDGGKPREKDTDD